MSEQSVDILVVGDGVSAKALLWELELQSQNKKILQVCSEKLFPKTSLSSTAIVAMHGMRHGVSPLGDLLCEGVKNFFKNVYGTGLMGMEKSSFFDLGFKSDLSKLESRYGKVEPCAKGILPFGETHRDVYFAHEDCIFINPKTFLNSLNEQFNTPLKNKTLVGIDDHTALFLGGDRIDFKKLVLCHGVGLTQLQGLGIKNNKAIKEVPGAFYKWKVNLGVNSFAYGLGGSNLVYRKDDHSLMLGGSTQQREIFSADHEALKNFYEKALNFGFDWIPAREKAEVIIGARVKGPKRTPLFEEVIDDVFILGAAYKNGWSQAFLGAQKISKKLL
ncbi:MAG: putative phosphodiesterase [Bacteriovoracaceae bacterium]|jgi:hypothetical protein